MKRIFTLLFIFFMSNADAQVLLNEVYPIPGSGRHEFFELFNNTTGAAPTSMDNYSIVTYFEQPGNKKGFYVLDLPAMSVPSQSYFVGAAAKPFNYQGVTNCMTANFSWNDTSFLHSNNGYLKKWVLASNVPVEVDGNEFYDMEAIPANFNDLFVKLGGGNATYNVFLYKNGTLINCFLGGTGGVSSSMPAYILAMPDIYIDMAGDGTDYSIPFSTYATRAFEYVIPDVGTDNGFIRKRDGYCGTWTKSSADANHTPGANNGGSTEEDLSVSIAAVIAPGNAQTGPYVVYDVVGAGASSFPITLQVYIDNGSVAGRLDAGDTYIESNMENVLTDGPFYTYFTPSPAGILIVVNFASGCIARVIHIPYTGGVLPLALTQFKANQESYGTELKWTAQSNERASSIEIQSSKDGQNFNTYKIITPTTQSGQETYTYPLKDLDGSTYFRLKLQDIEQKLIFSSSVYIEVRNRVPGLVIRSAAAGSVLNFLYSAKESAQATVSIYNATGSMMMRKNLSVTKDDQEHMLVLDRNLGTGIYILEIRTSQDRQTARFFKR